MGLSPLLQGLERFVPSVTSIIRTQLTHYMYLGFFCLFFYLFIAKDTANLDVCTISIFGVYKIVLFLLYLSMYHLQKHHLPPLVEFINIALCGQEKISISRVHYGFYS